jgi:hypothetical protein
MFLSPYRLIYPSLLLLPPLAAPAQTEWLEFNAGTQGRTPPLVQYNGTWDDLLAFDVEVRGLLADTVEVDSVRYLRFNGSPSLTVADSTGYPELPIARCFVWVPDNTDLTLSWTANCPQATASIPIYPAPLDSLREDSTSTPFIDEFFRKDSAAYASEQWYPDTLARLVGTFHLRDTPVAIVDVYPMQYLASDDSIRVWSDIEVALEFEDQGYDWSTADLGPYERLIGDRLLGYEPDAGPWAPVPGIVMRPEDLLEGPSRIPDYVILTAAGLDGWWVDTLAHHRADLNGFDVAIVRTDSVLSQFGGGAPCLTASIIRDFTEEMWEWGQPSSKRPSYLLLIGDHEDSDSSGCDWFLPTHTWVRDTTHLDICYGNDEWFTYFGEDRSEDCWLPDMMTGRLPVRDTLNLHDMIDLTISFEEEAGSPPYPQSMQYRRHVTRLAGDDHRHSFADDGWKPSPGWTDSLRQWLGYTWDNWYCGDGEDTWNADPPNPDGSRMTSAQWVDSLEMAFSRGSQVALYSNHGDLHLFSAGMNWDITKQGTRDSTFDNCDVWDLVPDHHNPPFILMLCCGAGTFNHTQYNHDNRPDYSHYCWDDDPPYGQSYDFTSDCLAEAMIKETDCGAIGVFAGSQPSLIGSYDIYGKGILSSIYCGGHTRLGDAIMAGRLDMLEYFIPGGVSGSRALGQFNLLGDPAVDIGDRVKFPDCCDLIVSPEDLQINRYPTREIGQSAEVELYVTVRNAGGSASGPFDVDLSVTSPGQPMALLTERCAGLDPGEEETLAFTWSTTWNPPGTIGLSAEADPDGDCDDSWTGNNSAEAEVYVEDFYPNDSGWPVKAPGSITVPPILVDLDGDDDLEIVGVAAGRLVAWEPTGGPPLWETGTMALTGSVPVAGNVCGDVSSEIVVDTSEGVLVFDSDGDPVDSLSHSFSSGFRTVTLVDLEEETGGPEREEIAVVANRYLYLLDFDGGELEELAEVELFEDPQTDFYLRSWQSATDLRGSPLPEVLVWAYWGRTSEPGPTFQNNGLFIYDHDSLDVVEEALWTDEASWHTAPCAGELSGNPVIAVSRRQSNRDHFPAYILDTSLAVEDSCVYNPSRESENLLCCMMADWDPLIPGLDRIIAPAENQCFVWDDDGREDWFGLFENETGSRPPFGALGNLDGDARDAELIVASRAGVVYAYDSDGNELLALGFPYTLPSEVYGGFVIADIDNDEKVEVVFGTMDNYLHVWELGSCDQGYAPWPQCQHDAQRTGVLE